MAHTPRRIERYRYYLSRDTRHGSVRATCKTKSNKVQLVCWGDRGRHTGSDTYKYVYPLSIAHIIIIIHSSAAQWINRDYTSPRNYLRISIYLYNKIGPRKGSVECLPSYLILLAQITTTRPRRRANNRMATSGNHNKLRGLHTVRDPDPKEGEGVAQWVGAALSA